MAITKQVLFSLLGIAAIGWALAALAPPHWQATEMILLLGGIALLWEGVSSEKQGRKLSRVKVSPRPSTESWFGSTSADLRDVSLRDLRPWDVEQSALRLAATRMTTATRPARSGEGSVEQLADEMLNRAFRRSRS